MNIFGKLKKGFTLIEIMIVLALIVIAIVVMMTQFGDASRQKQVEQTLQEISQLKGAISALRSPSDGWNAIAAASDAKNVLMNSSGVPTSIIRGGELKTTEGNVITVLGGYTSFSIAFTSKDPKSCQEIISKNLGGGWATINAGGTVAVASNEPAVTGGTDQTSVVTAQTACAAGNVPLIFIGN